MATTRMLQLALAALSSDRGLTDGELLARYAAKRDEEAFAEIVRRNGPLVLRACRAVLGQGPGVDDAFQAIFLLLARRADRMTRPGSLAGWLHATAVRIARTARRAEARRRRWEREARPQVSIDERTWREIREAIDVELAALPERYRTALVLCYLQDLSHEEAAKRAGCPVGALRGRLERGKRKLRHRLARHGLPFSAPAMILGAPEAVSASLTRQTLETARAWVSHGAIPLAIKGLLGTTGGLKVGLMASIVAIASLTALAVVNMPADTPTPKPAPVIAAPQAQLPRTDPFGDPLPAGATMRLGTRRFQVSTWPVRPVAIPGGPHYLLYHRNSDRAEFRWVDSTSGVVTAVWSIPDDSHAAGVSENGKWAVIAETKRFTTGIRTEPDPKTLPIEFTLYDLPARKPVMTFKCDSDEVEGIMAQVHGAVVSADGKWVATVNNGDSGTGRVRLWQVATGMLVWASAFPDINGPTHRLLGFTPGAAELILLASKDNRIEVLDKAKCELVRSFATMADQVDGMLLAPDGSAVILGTYSPKIRIWDLKTGKEMASFEGHQEWARRFAFTPDGKTLVTGGNDTYLLVRDWPSGTVRRRIDLDRGAVQDLFVSGDGHYVDVVFWWESSLIRYDLATGNRVARPEGTHRAAVIAVAAAADGSVLSVGVDKVLRLWDPATGRQLRTSPLDPGDGTRPKSLFSDGTMSDPSAISPDGRLRAQVGPDPEIVSVSDVKTRKDVAILQSRPAGWWASSTVPAFSPDGRVLAAVDGESVRFWAVDGWRAVGEIPAATSAVAFSPDGRSLATADLNDVTVWEVATRQPRATIHAAAQWPVRPQFSPDGRYLAWMLRSEAVEVWDLQQNKLAATFRGHEGRIRDFTFTCNSRYLVTASDDCTLLVWDMARLAAPAPADANPSEARVQKAWEDLASADAVRAFTAAHVLANVPERSVPLIRSGVRPAAAIDATAVDKLLADLDSDIFATRERASAGLVALGDQATEKIRTFLAANPSPEASRRAESVLETITGPPKSTSRLRELRAVEILEWVKTTDALALLKELSKGAQSARLTKDAATALRRQERESQRSDPR